MRMQPPPERPGLVGELLPAAGAKAQEAWRALESLPEPVRALLLLGAGALVLALFRWRIVRRPSAPSPAPAPVAPATHVARRPPAAPVAPLPPAAPPRRARRSACRWKRDVRRHGTRSDRWVCLDCRSEAFTWDGAPPKECKRGIRETPL